MTGNGTSALVGEANLTFDGSTLSVTSNLALGGVAASTAIVDRTINDGMLRIYGGNSVGANMQLFGSTHASFANQGYYNADTHTFRSTSLGATDLAINGQLSASSRGIFAGSIADIGGSSSGLISVNTSITSVTSLELRSMRTAIVANDVLNGVEMLSNDTNTAASGTQVALIRAKASVNHTASDLGTDLEFRIVLDGNTTASSVLTLDATTGNVEVADELQVGTFTSAGSRALCWDNAGVSLINDCNAAPIADYAEMYPASNDVEYGHIVALGDISVPTFDADLDSGELLWSSVIGYVSQVVKATSDRVVLGVLSDNYGDFSSTGHNIRDEDNPRPVALKGRVLVKVNMEGGEIAIGDKIALSSVAGVGRKATISGEMTVGFALESHTASSVDGDILVFVGNDEYLSVQDQVRMGLMNIDLSGSSTIFASLQTDPTDTVWNRLIAIAAGFTDGVLKLAGFKAETIETEELCIGNTCIAESELIELLENANQPASAPSASDPEPTPDPDPEPEPTPDPESQEEGEGDPVLEPTPDPEPVP
jgi:hypothetical protein